MNAMTRTLIYVAVAVVMVSLAVWKGLPSPEINPQDFVEVGTPFYPDFTDPNSATGIRVVVYNPDTDEVKPFEVKTENNQWKIPSHYNYPADGKDQLTKTATSLVAVKRGVVAGESELDFERLGVVDPLSEDSSKRKGRGERLTLTKGSETLLDIIIGNPVEGREGFYYVRKPEEKLTYIAELDVDLSTQFSDWIEPDLLQVDPALLREIVIRDYSIDEQQRGIKFNDILELHRPDAATPWELDGLKDNEELKTSEVNSIVTAVDGLKISGVRPKPAGMNSDLASLSNNPLALIELQSKGYFMVNTQNGPDLLSNEGDIEVVTAEGVAYTLRFGEVFTGSEFDIEVGSAQKKADEEKSTEDKKPAETQIDLQEETLKENRYLFVSVQFDEGALGPAPVKPTPPAKPEPAADKPAEQAAPEAAANPEEKPATEDAPAEKPADTEKPAADPQKEYEEALKKYEADLAAYELKVKAGQEKVEELKSRFANWYYVIDASSFDQLHKNRTALVEPKEPAQSETPAAGTEPAPSTPATPPVTTPEAATPPAAEKAPKMEAPATPKPATENPASSPAPAAEEAKPATPPAAPEKTPEKPATEPASPPATDTPSSPPAEEKSAGSEEKPAN